MRHSCCCCGPGCALLCLLPHLLFLLLLLLVPRLMSGQGAPEAQTAVIVAVVSCHEKFRRCCMSVCVCVCGSGCGCAPSNMIPKSKSKLNMRMFSTKNFCPYTRMFQRLCQGCLCNERVCEYVCISLSLFLKLLSI